MARVKQLRQRHYERVHNPLLIFKDGDVRKAHWWERIAYRWGRGRAYR